MTKISKEQAKYSAKSTDPRTVCSNCTHFVQPDECERVHGKVAAAGWCKLWAGVKRSLKKMAGYK